MVTLVMTERLAAELVELAKQDEETAGVLLARVVETPDNALRLLAREIHWVPKNAYLLRQAMALKIASDGYVPALAVAEATETIPIWLHTHPGEGISPRPSQLDAHVDQQLSELFQLRSGNQFYGAVIVAQAAGQLRFTGHLESDSQRLLIDRFWITGRRFTLSLNVNRQADPLPELFGRNIKAFGDDIQRVLGEIRVAIVGCGGTSSAVAEQLVRLGVRHFSLIDPDTLTASNLTRVYGAFPHDVGRPKVEVTAAHLRKIAPEAEVVTVVSAITVEKTAKTLLEADLVFGCTDDNAGRLVLSRVATYLLTPVIDCGVILTSDQDGRLDGIYGRVTVLSSGEACLVCRNRIDLARASAEMLTLHERSRLTEEGYAPVLPGVEPAVVAYTTEVAAAAVGELLERLIHYGPIPVPSEILLRMHDREISTNEAQPRHRHYCHPDSGKLGLGVTQLFLEQTWPA